MKFWSCCQKKTTEFDNFLDQAGCKFGKHAWTKEAAGKPMASCKYDWHQTGSNITVAVYAKGTLPGTTGRVYTPTAHHLRMFRMSFRLSDLSVVEVNRVHLRAHLEFDYGSSQFELDVPLWGAISVENSSVSATPNKVEIKLKKADPVSWPKLDYKE